MSKKVLSFFVLLLVAVISLTSATVVHSNSSTDNTKQNTNLKEVSIKNTKTAISSASRVEFNLKSVITGDNGDGFNFNTYVFKGKIVDLKEYEISWTDENGENWGPFSRSILEVEVTKEYKGKSPTDSNTIKVLYAHSLSTFEDDSVSIEKGGEYVFANCWIIDEKYNNYNKGHNEIQYKYDTSSQYADVIMGGAWCSLFPVENDIVYAYHGYFNNNEEAKKSVITNASEANKLTASDAVKSGDFVAIKESAFDKAFSTVIKDNMS